MNPFLETYHLVQSCMLPMMAAMIGALLLGTLIGWMYAPMPKLGPPAVRAELIGARKRIAEADEKLKLSASIMAQRLRQQDDEARAARIGLEKELAEQNAQINTLKTALVAAKRTVPTTPETTRTAEKVVPGPAHIARIAQLEKEVARIPGLKREIDVLRRAAPAKVENTERPRKASSKPAPLPDHVYNQISSSFGKRIAPDDLELVEGIGPKIAEQFKKNGLKTWADVAAKKPEELKAVLAKAGEHYQLHDPSSWPKQCKLMVEHRWDELRSYQNKLGKARGTGERAVAQKR